MAQSSAGTTAAKMDHPDLSKVRIWQWQGDNYEGSLEPRFRHLAHRLQDMEIDERLFEATKCEQELGKIKNEREEKARKLEWSEKVTWIHIPVNDMELCEIVLRRICRPGQANRLLRDENWLEQLHEPFNLRRATGKTGGETEVPFMDAKGWAFDFKVTNGVWKFEKGVHEWNHATILEPDVVRNTILYMPYLHWDYLVTQYQQTMARYMKAAEDRSTVHPRRSLDEASFRHHDYENLMKRNNDQVVTRFLEKEERKRLNMSNNEQPSNDLTLMMVDQLWLWVLDEDTIVTSFPDTPEYHDSEDRVKKKCEYLHLECLARGWFNNKHTKHGSRRLAECIINRSYSIFLHAHLREPSLRYLDMFRKSIEDERARCADLFLALRGRSERDLRGGIKPYDGNNWVSNSQRQQRASRVRPRDVLDIQEDITAVANTQDIEEELRIILHIVRLQIKTLKGPIHPRSGIFESELTEFKQELEELCEQARNVHERLFQTLELKQTLLSIRQNRIVLTFTIITIIFLPLGFMSSIFGMNATELSDGSPVRLSRIFTYMFPISLAISIITFGLAFGLFDSISHEDHVRSRSSWKTWRKHGNQRRISHNNDSRKESTPV